LLLFFVEELDFWCGGVVVNIVFGLGNFGLCLLFVGVVGFDFIDYWVWLECYGVDCGGVCMSELCYIVWFICMIDID